MVVFLEDVMIESELNSVSIFREGFVKIGSTLGFVIGKDNGVVEERDVVNCAHEAYFNGSIRGGYSAEDRDFELILFKDIRTQSEVRPASTRGEELLTLSDFILFT